MYCEKCGKKLEAGEICSCQKSADSKKDKKKFQVKINIYMLISLLVFVFGIEMVLYFYIGVGNFLELIPISVVSKNEWYFSCGIVMLIFAGGIVSGILAVRNKTARKAAVIILVLNVIVFLASCGVLGNKIYQNYKEKKPTVNEKTEVASEDTETSQENTTQESAGTEDNTEFIQAVMENAEELIQQGNIEQAKTILSDAYAVTNSEEIQQKLNELNGQTNSEQADLPSEKVFGSPEDMVDDSENQSDEIHRYAYFLSDGTWEDAYRSCIEMGGHLVTFESQEEFDYVSSFLSNNNMQDNIFFIGGRRNLDSHDYYWIDQNNNLTGNVLNTPDAWNSGDWLLGEPSFTDSSSGIEEHVLSIFYHTGLSQWVWNDVANDLVSETSSYSGKMGYICEYEN